MIPWTYNLMRERHPGVGLNPDFVAGMRNHGNALEAMLLYMQDTWGDLSANEDVQASLTGKQATNSEIMAAGYNSNAAKLPGYIRRSGPGLAVIDSARDPNVFADLSVARRVDEIERKSRAQEIGRSIAFGRIFKRAA